MAAIVYVTHPEVGAEDFARALVERQVAACVNILPTVRSIYRWEGKLESSPECLLLIKTDETKLDTLESVVLELHPYDVPEFVAVKTHKVSAAYDAWLKAAVKLAP